MKPLWEIWTNLVALLLFCNSTFSTNCCKKLGWFVRLKRLWLSITDNNGIHQIYQYFVLVFRRKSNINIHTIHVLNDLVAFCVYPCFKYIYCAYSALDRCQSANAYEIRKINIILFAVAVALIGISNIHIRLMGDLKRLIDFIREGKRDQMYVVRKRIKYQAQIHILNEWCGCVAQNSFVSNYG